MVSGILNSQFIFRTIRAFSFLAFVACNSAAGAETLVWGTTSFPPGYIIEGIDKGNGYADLLDRFMIEKLTQYEHEIVVSPNWERQLLMMRKGPLVCTSILWYRPPNERESIKGAYRVSAPSGVFFEHDVVVHKSTRHLYGKEVSFKELLTNQDLIFGYNRPYGITYNRILADHVGIAPGIELDAMSSSVRLKYLEKADNIYIRIREDLIGGLLKMLLLKRVDYVLEYEFMVRYQQKKLGFKDMLVSIPTIEAKNRVSWIAYACSDTPSGEKAIAAINEVLIKYRNTEEFKKTLAYLVPIGREKLYWKEFEKILAVEE